MSELEDTLAELEKAKKGLKKEKKKLEPWKVIVAIAVVIVIALVVTQFNSLGVDSVIGSNQPGLGSIPENDEPEIITNSYVCELHGKEYFVYEETYIYQEDGNLVLVSPWIKTTITQDRQHLKENPDENFFVAMEEATCVEDPEPARIMEEAAETDVISLGGVSYVL